MTATEKIYNKFSILKFSFFFLLIGLFSLFTASRAFAQTPVPSSLNFESKISTATATTTNQQPLTNNLYMNESPQYASMAFYNFGHALTCILIGQSPIAPCLEYRFIKNAQGMAQSVPVLSSVNTTGGLVGMAGSGLALLYTQQPLDQMSFVAYLGKNLGLVDETQAQVGGSGNQVLSPIFALWTVSRNFAYLVMILVFVVVGLMVMFRQKLNPQTVVSVQMALPGLVIGLILITFSYFLAALITDIAYVGTDIIGYYFDEAIKTNGGDPAGTPLAERLSSENVMSVGAGFSGTLDENTLTQAVGQMYSYLPPTTKAVFLSPQGVIKIFSAAMTYMFFNTMLSPILDVLGGGISAVGGLSPLAKYIGVTLNAAKVGNIAGALGAISGGLGTGIAAGLGVAAYNDPAYWISFWITILAVIILLYTLVKLFFRLINCYLTIIFLTISSPFVFLGSSIPGRQSMAVDWMKNMLCNILAFPAVIAVFYFAAFLLGSDAQVRGMEVTTPLDLTNATGNLPFLGGLDLGFLRKILAFAAVLTTPTIPDIICKSIGKPSQAGAALAGAIGGAIAGGQKYEGQMTGQIQKGAQDVGTWKQAMFGRREYTGGRLGALQSRLHGIDDPTYDMAVGHPDAGAKTWTGWINRRLEALRKAQPAAVTQSPYALHGTEGDIAVRRGGFGTSKIHPPR